MTEYTKWSDPYPDFRKAQEAGLDELGIDAMGNVVNSYRWYLDRPGLPSWYPVVFWGLFASLLVAAVRKGLRR